MKLTQEDFLKGLDLLMTVYGNDYPVFKHPDIAQIWFEFFAVRCNSAKFFTLIKHYVQMCPFFPRVPNDICKVWAESGDERLPGENWQAIQEQFYLSLPSTEAQAKLREREELKNISSEQMAENLKRLKILQKVVAQMKDFSIDDKQSNIDYLASSPLYELEAIAQTCHKAKQLSVKADIYGNLKVSPNALFEDMRRYFHSGSEKYRQVAIDWACDRNNGCELVKKSGQVVDIKQVEF